jgi:cation transport ATPase
MRAVAGILASDRPHRKPNVRLILLLVGIGVLLAAGWITWRCLDADAQIIIQEVSGWVFFLFCVIAILCVFFSMPGWIARDRRLPNADGIMTMGRVGLFFPPLWVVAFILALAGTPRPYDFAITTRRPCPECGESIARTARKCRFCGAAV